MNFSSESQKSRIMYSDSLHGNLPDELLEEAFKSTISAVLIVDPKEASIMGTLVGIEFSENPKVDIKISLENVFDFITNVLSNVSEAKSSGIILSLGDRIASFQGVYDIRSAKIVEIDIVNKSCVLAIDLIKSKE